MARTSPESCPAWEPAQDDGSPTELQSLVDAAFAQARHVSNLDLIGQADIHDADDMTREVVDLLPSGSYTHAQLASQLNSIITAHGWADQVGTVR